VFSLASNVGSGSTTTSIVINTTLDVGDFDKETEKWEPFIGQTIRVRSEDYTIDEEVKLLGVDSQNSNALLVDTLTFSPIEGFLVEIPEYNDADKVTNATYKLQFSHMSFQGVISSVASDKIFDVIDSSGLIVGSEVVINSPDYTRDSFETTVLIIDITGNTITLEDDLPFTPIVGDLIEHSNFGDDGFTYELI
jgi:hypothetical protein